MTNEKMLPPPFPPDEDIIAMDLDRDVRDLTDKLPMLPVAPTSDDGRALVASVRALWQSLHAWLEDQDTSG